MMATNKKINQPEPGEIEALLPWHAAGTLSARDMRRVDDALARDTQLAAQYTAIQDEYAATIALNENLGAPSVRAMQKLFAAIDAEPAQQRSGGLKISARLSGFFRSLSPRTLAMAGSLAALVVVLQAGVIGAMLLKPDAGEAFQTASFQRAPAAAMARSSEPITRSLVADTPARALVRFVPEARAADIAALLDAYQASVIDSSAGGLFRLQFGNRSMSRDEGAGLIGRLQKEKIVSLAVAAQ